MKVEKLHESITEITSNELSPASYMCNQNLESIRISDEVIKIPDFAFSRCFNLNSIKLPNNLKIIGRYSFEVCTGLETLEIPTTVKRIKQGAFLWCGNLTHIELPEGIEAIESAAFSNCDNLILTVPNSVVKLGASFPFYRCKLVRTNNPLVQEECDKEGTPWEPIN